MSDEKDPFKTLYTRASSVITEQRVLSSDKTFSFSASNMPFLQFVQIFSDSTGKGIVFDNSLDKQTVSFEFKNASPDEVMQLISRRFGLELLSYGNTYFVGTLKKEDRGYYIRRVKGYDTSEILAVVNSVLSEQGKSTISSDGVIFVSDRASVITQLRSMLDELEKNSADCWVTQFFLVLEKKDFRIDYGAEVTTSGELSFDLIKGQGGAFDYNELGQSLNLVFNSQSNFSKVRASPMLLLKDGFEGKWLDGQKLPIPKKTVSDQGTVTTTGFDYLDVGLQLTCMIRETLTGANLTFSLVDSSISGYVEYQPILRNSELSLSCPVSSGKVYLLGELVRSEDKSTSAKVFSFSDDTSGSRMQVFCRIYKVSSPVDEAIKSELKTCPDL